MLLKSWKKSMVETKDVTESDMPDSGQLDDITPLSPSLVFTPFGDSGAEIINTQRGKRAIIMDGRVFLQNRKYLASNKKFRVSWVCEHEKAKCKARLLTERLDENGEETNIIMTANHADTCVPNYCSIISRVYKKKIVDKVLQEGIATATAYDEVLNELRATHPDVAETFPAMRSMRSSIGRRKKRTDEYPRPKKVPKIAHERFESLEAAGAEVQLTQKGKRTIFMDGRYYIVNRVFPLSNGTVRVSWTCENVEKRACKGRILTERHSEQGEDVNITVTAPHSENCQANPLSYVIKHYKQKIIDKILLEGESVNVAYNYFMGELAEQHPEVVSDFPSMHAIRSSINKRKKRKVVADHISLFDLNAGTNSSLPLAEMLPQHAQETMVPDSDLPPL